jgi:flagellum-specific ATP synthase
MKAAPRTERWQRYLTDLQTFAGAAQPLQTEGTLTRVAGLVLEAAGIRVPVGSVCQVQTEGPGHAPVHAEVVGFSVASPAARGCARGRSR